ncbi:hypothetical protein [Streptomyces sp. CA-106131]|uniref:hypothetical protein n=1 Tax=Streptomyces sp. CA-106131 TaxID=3240045 RepID=UPI003D904998
MICARCDEPIKKDEPYVTRDIEAASGPGAVIHLHPWCQPAAAAQSLTYPVGRGAQDPWRF